MNDIERARIEGMRAGIIDVLTEYGFYTPEAEKAADKRIAELTGTSLFSDSDHLRAELATANKYARDMHASMAKFLGCEPDENPDKIRSCREVFRIFEDMVTRLLRQEKEQKNEHLRGMQDAMKLVRRSHYESQLNIQERIYELYPDTRELE